MPQLQPAAEADPFLALIGSGNGKYSTEDVMRLSRGEDWNQPQTSSTQATQKPQK